MVQIYLGDLNLKQPIYDQPFCWSKIDLDQNQTNLAWSKQLHMTQTKSDVSLLKFFFVSKIFLAKF